MKSHPKKYRIEWLKVKKPDWYEVTLRDLATNETQTSVSMNEKSKEGKPQWDNWPGLAAGHDVEGNLWQSTKGGWYLFPSQEDENANGVVVRTSSSYSGGSGGGKTAAMNAVMERKEHGIEKTMDRKEEGIRTSSTSSGATALAVAMSEFSGLTNADEQRDYLAQEWKYWRSFLLKEWDNTAF